MCLFFCQKCINKTKCFIFICFIIFSLRDFNVYIMCVYVISVTFVDLIMSRRPWKILPWLLLRERRTFHSLSLLFNILNTSTPRYLSNSFNRLSHFHNLGTRYLNNALFHLFLHTTPHFTLHLSQFLLIKLRILSLCLPEIAGHYLNSKIN